MIGALNVIPYYMYEVKDWQTKKEQFSQVLLNTTYTRPGLNGLGEFESDRDSQRNYVDDFLNIFQEEMQEFGRDISVDRFHITDIWSVQYRKHDHHTVHTHGNTNFSGILYYDYDHEEHTPTNFVLNNVNALTNMTDIITPVVKEGVIFIFPSSILHFTLPNKSDKIRRIVSFDISVKGKQ